LSLVETRTLPLVLSSQEGCTLYLSKHQTDLGTNANIIINHLFIVS